MAKKDRDTPVPNEPPPHPPGCICGPWKFVHGHWSFIANPKCKFHGNP